jgi:hypothetical protein
LFRRLPPGNKRRSADHHSAAEAHNGRALASFAKILKVADADFAFAGGFPFSHQKIIGHGLSSSL